MLPLKPLEPTLETYPLLCTSLSKGSQGKLSMSVLWKQVLILSPAGWCPLITGWGPIFPVFELNKKIIMGAPQKTTGQRLIAVWTLWYSTHSNQVPAFQPQWVAMWVCVRTLCKFGIKTGISSSDGSSKCIFHTLRGILELTENELIWNN